MTLPKELNTIAGRIVRFVMKFRSDNDQLKDLLKFSEPTVTQIIKSESGALTEGETRDMEKYWKGFKETLWILRISNHHLLDDALDLLLMIMETKSFHNHMFEVTELIYEYHPRLRDEKLEAQKIMNIDEDVSENH
jgi:hypothetical protein